MKEAVLPFARFPGVDTAARPRDALAPARSWAGTAPSRCAFLKAQLGAGIDPAHRRPRLHLDPDADKTPALAEAARDLTAMGFDIVATRGTAHWLESRRHRLRPRSTRSTRAARNIVDRLKNGDIALVMNTTEGTQAVERQPRHPRRRALRQDPLLHDGRRGGVRRGRDEGAAGGGDRGADVAGVRRPRLAGIDAPALRALNCFIAARISFGTTEHSRLGAESHCSNEQSA